MEFVFGLASLTFRLQCLFCFPHHLCCYSAVNQLEITEYCICGVCALAAEEA